MFDWVPQFVVNFMSSKALTDATGWVKKYSEAKWKEMELTTKGAAAPQETKKKWWFSKRMKPENEEQEYEEDEVALRKSSPTAVGLTRYALVTSVFCLSAWNVHLYFSQ